MGNRSTTISIRISESERAKLEAKAEEAGKSVSSYFRDSVIALNASKEVVGLQAELESLDKQREQIQSNIQEALQGSESRLKAMDKEMHKSIEKMASAASQTAEEVSKAERLAVDLQGLLKKDRISTFFWSSTFGAGIAALFVFIGMSAIQLFSLY